MKNDARQYAGPSSFYVKVGNLELWFSYLTLVAFKQGCVSAVRENGWGNTTGKHINAAEKMIGRKHKRMTAEEFETAKCWKD